VSFGIPLSLLADRVNRRNIIAVSLIVWSAMTVLCGRAASYWQLLLPRIGVGIARPAAHPQPFYSGGLFPAAAPAHGANYFFARAPMAHGSAPISPAA